MLLSSKSFIGSDDQSLELGGNPQIKNWIFHKGVKIHVHIPQARRLALEHIVQTTPSIEIDQVTNTDSFSEVHTIYTFGLAVQYPSMTIQIKYPLPQLIFGPLILIHFPTFLPHIAYTLFLSDPIHICFQTTVFTHPTQLYTYTNSPCSPYF